MSESKPLAGRIALVTGVSRGIGQATAVALAQRGAHVVGTVRSRTGLEELESEIRDAGGTLEIVVLDITDVGGIAAVAADIKARHGRLDILDGNAGVPGPNLALTEVTPKDWDETMMVNLTANWHLIRYFDALLRAAPAARVVFVSSGSAARVAARRGPYSISKAALEALVRTYANETASSNVRVNLFNPGPIRTRMRAAVAPAEDPMTLDTPAQCAEKLVALCLPAYTATGTLYDYIIKDFVQFRKPTLAVGPTG
jgi:NAD(P)-dependent dehydrogenase (short-subunit alcohol dehydrogenase family)